jgi:hypothetical protein
VGSACLSPCASQGSHPRASKVRVPAEGSAHGNDGRVAAREGLGSDPRTLGWDACVLPTVLWGLCIMPLPLALHGMYLYYLKLPDTV